MGSVRRRLEALEGRIPAPDRSATEAGRKLLAWLDGYSARKRAGLLTAEDEAQAEEIRAALKRRRRELGRL